MIFSDDTRDSLQTQKLQNEFDELCMRFITSPNKKLDTLPIPVHAIETEQKTVEISIRDSFALPRVDMLSFIKLEDTQLISIATECFRHCLIPELIKMIVEYGQELPKAIIWDVNGVPFKRIKIKGLPHSDFPKMPLPVNGLSYACLKIRFEIPRDYAYDLNRTLALTIRMGEYYDLDDHKKITQSNQMNLPEWNSMTWNGSLDVWPSNDFD